MAGLTESRYLMGETFCGFQDLEVWYTIMNGLAASLATSVYREIIGTLFPAAITVSRSRMVGFAHTLQ